MGPATRVPFCVSSCRVDGPSQCPKNIPKHNINIPFELNTHSVYYKFSRFIQTQILFSYSFHSYHLEGRAEKKIDVMCYELQYGQAGHDIRPSFAMMSDPFYTSGPFARVHKKGLLGNKLYCVFNVISPFYSWGERGTKVKN